MKMNNKLKFCQQVKEARAKAGYSLGSLAKITGLSPSFIFDLEINRTEELSPIAEKKLAEALGIDHDC